MQALSGNEEDVRAIHAVLHAMEAKVETSARFDVGKGSRRSSVPARNRRSLVERPVDRQGRLDPRSPSIVAQNDA